MYVASSGASGLVVSLVAFRGRTGPTVVARLHNVRHVRRFADRYGAILPDLSGDVCRGRDLGRRSR